MYQLMNPVTKLSCLYLKQGKPKNAVKDAIYKKLGEYGLEIKKEQFDTQIWPLALAFVSLATADDLLKEEIKEIQRPPGKFGATPGAQ